MNRIECLLFAMLFLSYASSSAETALATITITDFTQGPCNDNGTPLDPTDDWFTISINATNPTPGPSDRFEVVVGATVLGNSPYGTAIIVGDAVTPPFMADGVTTYTVTIRDIDDNTCNQTAMTTTVMHCSNDCLINNISIITDPCDNQGTTTRPDDDTFDATVNATSINGGPSNQFTVTDGITVWGPFTYGVGGIILDLPADGNIINLTFTDVDNPTCPETIPISVDDCSNCDVQVAFVATDCNDNGTPDTGADDWFSVDLTIINPFPNPSGTFEVLVGGVVVGSGPYGVPLTVGDAVTPPFTADGGSVFTLLIRDIDDPECFEEILVGPVDPCSNCDAGIIGQCSSAPILCSLDDLLGFTCRNPDEAFTINTSPPTICPAVGGGTIQNPSWFAFVAGEAFVSMTLLINNCEDGNGVQIGFYENCTAYPNVPGNTCSGVANMGSLVVSSNSFVPGEIYYVLIDGWAGDECDYTITNIIGGGIFDLGDPSAFMGPTVLLGDTMCLNNPATIQIADNGSNILNAFEYSWTLTSAQNPGDNQMFVTTVPETEITLTNEGSYTLCVSASHSCDVSGLYCEEIYVEDPDDEILDPYEFCITDLQQGGIFPPGWQGPAITSLTPNPAIHTIVRPDGCMFDQIVDLEAFPPPDPVSVDTAYCGPGPVSFNGEPFFFSVSNYLQTLANQAAYDCDSLIDLSLSILFAQGDIAVGDCFNGEIMLVFNELTIEPIGITNVTYTWFDPMGDPIQDGNADDTNLVITSGGEYTLDITLEEFGHSCTYTFSSGFVDLESLLPPAPVADSWDLAPCESGTSVTYSVVPVGGETYDWSIPSDATIVNNTPTSITVDWSYSAGGMVCVQASNFCGFGPQTCMDVILSPAPSSDFSAVNSVCVDTAAMVLYVGTASGLATYTWDFDGGTELTAADPLGPGPFRVSWPTSGDKEIELFVEENGCISSVFLDTVTVVDPPTPPLINCNSTSSELTFTWSDVDDVAVYDVVVVEGSTGTINGNSYEVSGLNPGDSVSIQLVLTPSNGCGEILSDVRECFVENCPVVSLDVTNAPVDICLDDPALPIDLEVDINPVIGNGVLSFSGNGITDAVAGIFDPATAGLGMHDVVVSYAAANCLYQEQFEVAIYEIPDSEFSTTTDTLCVGDTLTLVYDGGFSGGNFDWDFAGASFSDGADNGPIKLVWDNAGLKDITLVVTNASCPSDMTMRSVFVDSPLPPIDLVCSDENTTAVQISWDGVTGVQFEVFTNGMSQGIQTDTFFDLGSLTPGSMIDFTVQTVSDHVCGDIVESIQCVAQNCPAVVLDFTNPPGTICLDSSTQPFDLAVSANPEIPDGLLSFSGNGVTDMVVGTFDPALAGVGSHDIMVEYSAGSCSYQQMITLDVVEVPDSDFSINADTICVGDTLTLTYAGGFSGGNFDWDFAGASFSEGGAEGPIKLVWNNAGPKDLVLVIMNDPCVSGMTQQAVFVDAPLPPINLTCADENTDAVQISWDNISGAEFEVFVNDISQGVQNETFFDVDNLMPGTMVDFRVETRTGHICGDLSESLQCIAQNCPPIAIAFNVADTTLCLDASVTTIDLDPMISGGDGLGNGVGVWSGDAVDAATGVFDPQQAGVGVFMLQYDYAEGLCTESADVRIEIIEDPIADFDFDTDTVCLGDPITVTFSGQDAGAVLDWTFDGTASVVGSGNGPYELSYDMTGMHTIRLSIDNQSCTSSLEKQVFVESPLEPINLRCDAQGTSFVSFVWDNVNDGIMYNVVLNGMAIGIQDSTSFTVDGLDADEAVELAVTVLSTNSCPDWPEDIQCVASSCPPMDIQFNIPDTMICVSGTATILDLDAILSNGEQGGIEQWSGTGIVDASAGLFDPNISGSGSFTIDFMYINDNCTYPRSLVIDVGATPTADFTAATALCITQALDIEFTGAASANANFSWETDGGDIQGSFPGPYSINWDTPGLKTIMLEIQDGFCRSETQTMVVDVQPELIAPEIHCETSTTGVNFSWNTIDCADRFTVFADGSAFGSQTDTTFSTPGLAPGTSVELLIIAESDCACGNVSATLTCSADACPINTITIDAVPDFCLDDAPGSVQLSARVSNEVNDGSGSWSGPGTSADGVFDPLVAGVGTHEVRYTYTADAACVSDTSTTIRVFENPSIQFVAEDPDCIERGQTGSVDIMPLGGNGIYDVLLDGASVSGITVENLNPGDHLIEVIDGNGCRAETSFTIEPVVNPEPVFLTGPETIEFGDEMTANASSNIPIALVDSISWSVNGGLACSGLTCAETLTFAPENSGQYCVTYHYNNTCTATACANVLVDRTTRVFIPNVFHPGTGGTNAYFTVFSNSNIVLIRSMRVFDRWGNLVFERSEFDVGEPELGWDGTKNGDALLPGVYVYAIELLTATGGVEHHAGDITLLR